jgi:hypothetical protein
VTMLPQLIQYNNQKLFENAFPSRAPTGPRTQDCSSANLKDCFKKRARIIGTFENIDKGCKDLLIVSQGSGERVLLPDLEKNCEGIKRDFSNRTVEVAGTLFQQYCPSGTQCAAEMNIRFPDTLKLYKEASDDSTNEKARQKVKELDTETEAHKQERLAYIKEKLEIRDMKVKDLGNQEYLLYSHMLNNGDKKIKKASCEILYYDAQGRVIKKSPFPFIPFPGPRSGERNSIMLHPPEGWGRQAELKIVDIKFLDE